MEKIEQMKFKDFEKLQKEWMKTFELTDINQDFIPELPRELREYFKQDIHLKIGSLIKLINKNRIGLIDDFQIIRDALEDPDVVLKDSKVFVFIKDKEDNKRVVFTSIAKNSDNELIVSSNHYKKISRIKNIILDDGELVYEREKGLLLNIIENKSNDELKLIKQKLKQEKSGGRSR